MITHLFSIALITALASSNVREVSATSCKAVPVFLSLGMTTQIVFEQEPKVTLYADKKHFKINTNSTSPRSLAIIPYVEPTELNELRGNAGQLPKPKVLASLLDNSFKTNLIVFFENSNQLMFDLRFVEKKKTDYVVRVKQIFKGDCNL